MCNITPRWFFFFHNHHEREKSLILDSSTSLGEAQLSSGFSFRIGAEARAGLLPDLGCSGLWRKGAGVWWEKCGRDCTVQRGRAQRRVLQCTVWGEVWGDHEGCPSPPLPGHFPLPLLEMEFYNSPCIESKFNDNLILHHELILFIHSVNTGLSVFLVATCCIMPHRSHTTLCQCPMPHTQHCAPPKPYHAGDPVLHGVPRFPQTLSHGLPQPHPATRSRGGSTSWRGEGKARASNYGNNS